MGISTVKLNGTTLMTVDDTTADASEVLSGQYFYAADGTKTQGSIATKTASNLSVSGATVTAPAGYYASAASVSVASGTAGTPSASKGTVSNHSISVTPTVTNTTGYITGGTISGTAVTVSASELVSGTLSISSSGSAINVTNYSAVDVPAGSAFTPAKTITVNPSFSLNSSTGVITATASGSSSITPTVNAGYISAGTAGTVSVSGTSTYALSTQAAQTFYPSTVDQTLASERYLTGTQTFKSVVTTNLLASNIASGVTIKIGDLSDDDRIAAVTGTFAGGGSVVDVTIPLDFRDLTYNASDGPIVGIMRTGAPTGYNVSAQTITLPQSPCYGNFTNGTTYHIKGVFNRVGAGKAYSIDTDFVYSSALRLTWTEDGSQNTITMSISTTSQQTFGCTFYVNDLVLAQETYNMWADFTITKVETIDGFRSVSVDRTSSPYLTLLSRFYSGLFSDSLYSNAIGKYAFAECSKLSGAFFDKATAVLEGAFYSTVNLVEVRFPSASLFSSSAFYNCMNLKTISAANVSTVGASCFYSCRELISASFPNISSVPSHMFWGCTKLESVYLPNVKSIGVYAFANCNALQTFDLSSVSTIASYGFAFCNSLSTLINTSSLTSIGLMAFGSCSSLAGVSADTIVSLGSLALNGEGTSAFAYCPNLSYAYFSEVTQVGCYVFYSCPALTDVSIPKLQSIGQSAFAGCTALSNVSFPQLTSISTYGFSNCASLSGVSFSMLTTLGSNAFHTCTNLSYAYFATLNTIGSNAFRDCSNLTDVSIPLVSVISQSGFYGCQNLSALVLPAASQIQASAFTSCYHLLSLYVLASSMCALAATNAFASTPISNYTTSTGGVYGSIFVPESLYNTYKNATNWKTYSARFASLTDAEISAILG